MGSLAVELDIGKGQRQAAIADATTATAALADTPAARLEDGAQPLGEVVAHELEDELAERGCSGRLQIWLVTSDAGADISKARRLMAGDIASNDDIWCT